MDVTLIVNGLDLHEVLSTYRIKREPNIQKTVTTLGGREIAFPYANRFITVISFSLWPLDDGQSGELFEKLSPILIPVTWSDQYSGEIETATARLTSSLESSFGIRSSNGKRYYKGGTIELRVS